MLFDVWSRYIGPVFSILNNGVITNRFHIGISKIIPYRLPV